MSRKQTLITAAGGNGTAIEIIDKPLTRPEYEALGKVLGDDFEVLGAEQAGFLVVQDRHFEMAGGEFCGNATRSAAVLFSNILQTNSPVFTVSGFNGTVSSTVEKLTESVFLVESTFQGLSVSKTDVTLRETSASIVDLGGIVHVVIHGELPDDYESMHKAITHSLGLTDRDAVGVVWYTKGSDGVVAMHPIVWVRAVDTFFYETSCGSGTIAVGKVTQSPSILQPSGKEIETIIGDDFVILKSEMEIVR